jgi:hypothetical protein
MNKGELLNTPLSNDVIGIITNYLDYSLDKIKQNITKNHKTKFIFKNPDITLLDILVIASRRGYRGIFMGENLYNQLNMRDKFSKLKNEEIVYEYFSPHHYIYINYLNKFHAIYILSLDIIDEY